MRRPSLVLLGECRCAGVWILVTLSGAVDAVGTFSRFQRTAVGDAGLLAAVAIVPRLWDGEQIFPSSHGVSRGGLGL